MTDICNEARPDERAFTLDLTGCCAGADMHARLKTAFSLPDYYGMNFDALWDCLCELFAAPISTVVTVTGQWDTEDIMQEKIRVLMGLFAELEEKYPHVHFVTPLAL